MDRIFEHGRGRAAALGHGVLSESALCEPKVQLGLVLEDARELAAILGRAGVRERLRSVGVPEQMLDQLVPAIDALAQAEARWARARDRGKTERQVQAEALAYSLRDEMVAACRFHLDGVEVLELLARVTDGESTRELVLDLRELAHFVREHGARFRGDTSFDPSLCADEAVELAHSIALDVVPDDADAALLEERDRAFTHVCRLVEQLRRAGRYAYRGTAEARAYFAAELVPSRPRRALASGIRALVG